MSTRKIGPVLATFVVANNMIGSGFFLLPASLAASGAVTVFSWIAGTVLALVPGGAFARLARDYPDLSSADDSCGGASWRERVCQYVYILVVAVPFKKQITHHTS